MPISTKYRPLIITVLVVVYITLGFLFFSYLPWLDSEDISRITLYENPSPPPPEWAKAFSINHGSFSYYRESVGDNPKKVYIIVVALSILILPLGAFSLWTVRQSPTRLQNKKVTHPKGGYDTKEDDPNTW